VWVGVKDARLAFGLPPLVLPASARSCSSAVRRCAVVRVGAGDRELVTVRTRNRLDRGIPPTRLTHLEAFAADGAHVGPSQLEGSGRHGARSTAGRGRAPSRSTNSGLQRLRDERQ